MGLCFNCDGPFTRGHKCKHLFDITTVNDYDNDNNNEEEDDEVVTGVEWDDLGSEDTLTDTYSSMQGPFSFHARDDAAVRPEEVGRTIGPSLEPSGAGRSATAPEVPAEGSGPAIVPQEIAGMGGPVGMPQEPVGVGGSAAMPEVPREGSGSTAVPPDVREARPSAREQGWAQNGLVSRRWSMDLGVRPPNICNIQQRPCKSSTPLFFLFLA